MHDFTPLGAAGGGWPTEVYSTETGGRDTSRVSIGLTSDFGAPMVLRSRTYWDGDYLWQPSDTPASARLGKASTCS